MHQCQCLLDRHFWLVHRPTQCELGEKLPAWRRPGRALGTLAAFSTSRLVLKAGRQRQAIVELLAGHRLDSHATEQPRVVLTGMGSSAGPLVGVSQADGGNEIIEIEFGFNECSG